MRILQVLVALSVLVLTACSSGTTGTGLTSYGTGTGTIPGYTYQNGSYQYDQSYDQYGYGDDLPSGVYPAIFGWDGRDFNVFLGLVIDPNNSYSACNPYTFGNAAQQESLRNQYTFGNPYSSIGAYNPQAQTPPFMFNYDTNTGQGTPIGWVRKGGNYFGGYPSYDPDSLCR